MPTYTATCDPGFEDLVVAELGGVATALPGHVEVTAPVDELLRSPILHHVVRPVARFPLRDLDDVRARVAALAATLPELAADGTFCVRCTRVGEHPFTSEDVERIAGAGVRDAVLRPVRLRDPDVLLRCDVVGDEVHVGVQLTRRAASRRDPGPFRPVTTLRPSVAWHLLTLAGPPRRLLDPCCGAGTILVEAGRRWPAAALCGSDLHDGPVRGTRTNLAAAGLVGEVRRGDARRLVDVWPEAGFDRIVTNPPFGRRLGAGLVLDRFYGALLAQAAQVATADARLVLLAEDRGAVNRALATGPGWRTLHVRVVELGGLYVGAFLLARAG